MLFILIDIIKNFLSVFQINKMDNQINFSTMELSFLVMLILYQIRNFLQDEASANLAMQQIELGAAVYIVVPHYPHQKKLEEMVSVWLQRAKNGEL